MSTLTVWKFPSAEGAERVETTLKSLQNEGLIKILDAAVVTWPADRSKSGTKQLINLVGAGALSGKPADIGIDDDFIAEVKEKATPGTSALFLLTVNEAPDRIGAALPDGGAELLHSNLDTRSEARLREIFGEDATRPSGPATRASVSRLP
ncbi:DUF1269 domain-containing protein [Streptomyces sp. NPDC101194]|uniref:DUF1269 domain-containing protein n=1 Tax=Streptomyces sp. NPDC101194 TaxID=3366127 RepID=UPI0037FA88DA